MIDLQDVSKSFDGGRTWAVRDVSLHVAEGELLVLLGSSGCGKTTTLKIINRLVDATRGTRPTGVSMKPSTKLERSQPGISKRLRSSRQGEGPQHVGPAAEEGSFRPSASVLPSIVSLPRVLGVPVVPFECPPGPRSPVALRVRGRNREVRAWPPCA